MLLICNPSVERLSIKAYHSSGQKNNSIKVEQHYEIVEACKRGDRKAQFELYRLYSKAMYNISLRMLGSVENAEDVLQNSFIDVFSKLDSFRFESSIGAWIKRIVINNCINYLKKRRLEFAELTEGASNEVFDQSLAFSALSDNHLDVPKIQNAIQQLPDGYRVVFTLYAMEGYDHEEIGSILGITEATSKSQYSRAKAKLRDILQSPRHVRLG
ncbi:MAG: RNA polymerase sigma factor [Saprospiraceae bacterium]|nr:RNA polymerase sigma factor [Saprospiraceae bacterium]